MAQPKKQVIIISQDGKPVLLCTLQEVTAAEYISLGEECKKNRTVLKECKKEKEKVLLERIAHLEEEIKILKGED